jgi:hypothetical protein
VGHLRLVNTICKKYLTDFPGGAIIDFKREIAQWYRGKTVIKDDAIPSLLRQQSHPTFVTINEKDFWRKVPIDAQYCVICFTLPGNDDSRHAFSCKRTEKL